MQSHRGHFNHAGLPTIELEVHGAVDRSRVVTAVIDTGYSGYLSLDYKTAFPLGLTLEGLSVTQLADGSSLQELVCKGTVALGDTRITSAIDVSPKGKTLAGMSFFKDAHLFIEIDATKGVVELTKA
jgi:predicted aspartyl protease